ncbi:hypothetical protein [Opitutus sp. ER46]|uniref:hypothetical protein n=1 Tax=Opitutus sp. ER46 TaxID=2161864 RepID=UPI000D2FDB61|nr:hypothetical protein [Opitutus sp. ER46]PTX98591.1 hypothetical protein DB354_04825 [Opitutus sp. ER46]
MPATLAMNELAARKQLLIAESDLHRQMLATSTAQLRQGWSSVSGLAGGLGGGSRWLLLGGLALGGFLAVRHWRSLLRWAPSVLGAWRMFR